MTGWRKLTIRDAIIIIMSDVLKKVSSGCMNDMWQKLCPEHVHDIHGFNTEENVKSHLT
jgi:hypothetical protein